MRPVRPPRAWLAALAAALLLPGAPALAAARPSYGRSARVAIPGPVSVVDPALAESPQDLLVVSLVHQPPLARDAAGDLRPVLLERGPETSDGGRTFTLVVRAGLTFHDGTPVDALDVAAALKRLSDPRTRSPHAVLVLPVRGVEVRGQSVLVTLAFPCPRWPEALAEPALAIVPRRAVAGRPPPGAGPFRLVSAGEHGATLAAFEDHAGGRPFLDGVTLTPMPDARARRALEGGAIDLALLPGETAGIWTGTALLLGPSAPPALRAALEPGLDREELVRWFVPGGASPLRSLLPPFAGEGRPARASPAPAGGPIPVAALALSFDPSAPGHRAVAERIQLRLHERGVAVRLQPVPGGELRGRVARGAHELALVRVPVPHDPGLAAAALLLAGGRDEDALSLLSHVGAAGPPADAALAAARAEARRLADAPVVPLWASGAALESSAHSPVRRAPSSPSLADAWREAPPR